jgi:methionyl-tRNA formyltransferase
MTRIVFMGSPDIACLSLQALHDDKANDIVGVITQPDRPKGRRLQVSPCPANACAQELGLTTYTPESINSEEALALLRELEPDLIVVVAYGQILRPTVLEMAPLGCINMHTSLLPRYRGAAPIQWAIVRGETVSGVTTMFMDAGMDTGDMILKADVPLGPETTAGELHDKLATTGARLLIETVKLARESKAPRFTQDEALATYAPKLTKADGHIDWRFTAVTIHNQIRGLNPWPCGACTTPDSNREPPPGRQRMQRKTLRVLRSEIVKGAGVPGTIIRMESAGPVVACGEKALLLIEVQPEGKRRMQGSAYLCGHDLCVGDVLT